MRVRGTPSFSVGMVQIHAFGSLWILAKDGLRRACLGTDEGCVWRVVPSSGTTSRWSQPRGTYTSGAIRPSRVTASDLTIADLYNQYPGGGMRGGGARAINEN